MDPQPGHEYEGNMPEEGSQKGLQGTVSLYRPWHRLVSHEHLLLLASAIQFVLFVPLAWWAHKHPHPPVELGLTHILQQKRATWLRSTITALSTITGSAILVNVLVVPTAAVLWRRRLRLEAIVTMGISWTCTLVRIGIQQVVS